MKEFYASEYRKGILQEIQNPENKFKSLTEETGLRILDGVYILIEMLRKDKLNGAQ